MTSPLRSTESAKQLQETVRDLAGVQLPSHVVNRMSVFTGDRPPVYVDAPLTRDMYTLNGAVHVFTADLLITAQLVDTLSGADSEGQWKGDVTVTVLPRSGLTSMATVPNVDDGSRNFNAAWVGTEILRWPNYAELRLQYRDPDLAVVLGSPTMATIGTGTSPLDAFVDSLVQDLTRP